MDLTKYTLKDLLLAAMKSETDSKTIYMKLSKKVKNGLLKDKLQFLAKEEEKHRNVLEQIHKERFPQEKIVLPKKSIVPLPELTLTEDTPISNILENAMHAEQNASDFYQGLSLRFTDNKKIANTLLYFSKMELEHYKILELEKENMENFEAADMYLPMIHVGP
jgi:rubrerythrin